MDYPKIGFFGWKNPSRLEVITAVTGRWSGTFSMTLETPRD
jgi:hypothetical protein